MTDIASLPRSTAIEGFEWLGESIAYRDPAVRGDTYPMTWADDGEIYASAGDPCWGDKWDGLDFEKFAGGPTDHTITKINTMPAYTGWGGNGPKPSGLICVGGTLYLAFQNLLGKKAPACGIASQHGTDAHISSSTDHGRTWEPIPGDIAEPMFPGHLFGGPAFIQFGRDNAGAKDEFVYAVSGDQWDNGTQLRLGRVPADSILRREAWQWVSGIDRTGQPRWNAELDKAAAVLALTRSISLPEMVWVASVRRYLLLTWRLHQDFSPDHGTDLIVLESPEPWGPFSLVYSEELWEGIELTPYCPRLPLKWIEPDGVTGWLQFSGTWRNPARKLPYYRSHVRRFRLKLRR